MSSQYIRLLSEELNISQKGLIEAQLSSLTTIKHLQEYRKLRNEEFALKIALKSKIDELVNDLKSFEKTLPVVPMKKEQPLEVISTKNPEIQEVKMSSLDAELASLKAKLASFR